MNGLTIILIAVGIFLVLVGVVLLVIKVQASESGELKPIFQGPGRIMVSGPVGLVVIVIGVFCLIVSVATLSATKTSAAGSPQIDTTPSASQTSLNPDQPSARLLTPSGGAHVSRSQGFTATGTASVLGTATIWILDYDGGYTVDQEAIVTSGKWSAIDKPLGASTDHLPFSLTMVAALADPRCAAILTKLNESNNDYTSQLPSGCKLFGQVTVNVTRP